MPIKTGLPQHIVDELIESIPLEYQTSAEINATIDSYISSHRRPRSRMQVTTLTLKTLYVESHLTLREIGLQTGLSPQAVAKRLKKAGVEIQAGTWVNRRCGFCGSNLKVNRAKARKSENSYCNSKCYGAAWSSPGSFEWRHGTRLARAIVEKYYLLTSEMVVDHKNGDERNNDLTNLRVFASQSDHMRSHHGHHVIPLWEGTTQFLVS